MGKTVITYGTFDMFHVGHLRLLKRMRTLGQRTIVCVSTDEFNHMKGKQALIPFAERKEIVESLDCVDLVIPEDSWEQKVEDIRRYEVDVFVMGDDWQGHDAYLHLVRDLLCPGGVHRLVTADLQRILDSAASGAWASFAWVKKAGLRSSADYLNMVFRSWGHRYLYDQETLVQRFIQAGYRDVERFEMMQGASADLYFLDRDRSRLYVEARC